MIRALTLLDVSLRRARQLACIGIGGLLFLVLVYGLTIQKAPGIRVRWRDSLSQAGQAELEWKYLLTNGRAPAPNAPRSLAYDLQDTSRRNVRALVRDPDVADTNDIDRDEFRVRPKTRGGDRWRWAGHNVPLLRRAEGLWLLVAALAMLAAVGVRRLIAERRRQAALCRPSGLETFDRDLFDNLATVAPLFSPIATDAARYPLRRVGAACLVLLAIGVPVLDTWKVLFFGLTMLALVFGVGRPERKRLLVATLLVLTVVLLKAALPRADIAEGHNAFMVMRDGEPLQQGLPPLIFQNWKAQFDALYPAETEPYPAYSWRTQEATPTTLFSASSDAIWRVSPYSRQVDAIDFTSLAEFRGGFANDGHFSFWNGQIDRGRLPFFVMYELTAASAGSELAWSGQVFWQRADGGFDEIVHSGVSARLISPQDAGRRVYAAFFQKDPAPGQPAPQQSFTLRPSLTLRLAGWTEAFLTLVGGLGVLVLTLRLRWPEFLRSAVTCLSVYLLTILYHGATLGRAYPPHGGGDDGLSHESWGRIMAMLAGRGHVVEALRGGEDVYWFTPGLRYVRMVEKLLFGDTNHLYALLLAIVPLTVFYLMRHFIGARRAWMATAVFACMPVGSFSFLQYVVNARIGYAEAAGAELFLLGLVLLLRTPPSAIGLDRNLPALWASGALLAVSMFIRPNYSLAVVSLGGMYTWQAGRRGNWRVSLALACGLGVALWMPFHNWYYGGEFYLISRSGSTREIALVPSDYLRAIGELLSGRFDGPSVTLTSEQIASWVSEPGFPGKFYREYLVNAGLFMRDVRLFGIAASIVVLARWVVLRGRNKTDLEWLSVAALSALAPLLFISARANRHGMLGWDLSLMVLIVVISRNAWLIGPDGGMLPAWRKMQAQI